MSKRFWLSWNELAKDYRPLSYPPNSCILGWWCTGYDDTSSRICAWVTATDEEAAKAAVALDWPGAKDWRFCAEVGRDWEPSDRFPLAEWTRARVNP
jgi:hypothetical protein